MKIMKTSKSKTLDLNETEYLLSSKKNAERLVQSIEQLRKGQSSQHDLIEPHEDEEPCSDKDV